MALQPINLPPGVYKNGTDYQSAARWIDTNLVRWHHQHMQAMGGWQRRQTLGGVDIPALVSTPSSETIRDVFAWRRDANNERQIVFGSNSAAYLSDASGAISTITPAGVTAGDNDVSVTGGYGSGPYGSAAYGSARQFSDQDVLPPLRWSFSDFGQTLMAVQRGTGSLYSYTPGVDSVMQTVGAAPTAANGVVVTDQRIVMLIGFSGAGPRKVQWCDQEDFTEWTAASSNQAGDITLSGNGELLGGVRFLQDILIFSTTEIFEAVYTGPPYVFSFNRKGTNCGPLCIDAVVATDDFVVWPGQNQFWYYSGSLEPLPSDLADFFYDDIDPTAISKIAATTNQDHNEIWWLYQSSGASEIDKYIVWNYKNKAWYKGSLARTAMLDKGVTNVVLAVDSSGVLWNHDLENVFPTDTVFAESGALELGDGEQWMVMRRMIPDARSSNDFQIKFYAAEYPLATEIESATYECANYMPLDVMGRQIRMRVEALDSGFKFGKQRFDITAGPMF